MNSSELNILGTLQRSHHDISRLHRRDAELRRVESGLQAVRARPYAGYEAKGDSRALAQTGGRFFDELELVRRIDIDRIDACVDRFGDLRPALGDAIHFDLVRTEACFQGTKELSSGVHLDINAGLAHKAQDSQQVVGLRGVTEFDS
jgi:hypothetical protein